MKLAWSTDLHLDIATLTAVGKFCARIRNAEADKILLGGDICDGIGFVRYLELIDAHLERDIYFVLGNHDHYYSRVSEVDDLVRRFAGPRLHSLRTSGVVRLTSDTALIGVSGWSDIRIGDLGEWPLTSRDFDLIPDLRECFEATGGLNEGRTSRQRLQSVLKALADGDAGAVRPLLSGAAQEFRRILFLTHVPPFEQACWESGRRADEQRLPLYTCKAVGDVLEDVADANRLCELTVLCGHTHSRGVALVAPNLTVYTGGSRHGHPDFTLLDADLDDFGLGLCFAAAPTVCYRQPGSGG